MLNDIISDHKERMLNLKKYYPFFKLTEVSFTQFKNGKYQVLDMGYIVMGILRFFIEENNFNEKDVTYSEYLTFITGLLRRDFDLKLSDDEFKEIADYIFDKIKNDGRPFYFEYYDPVERKKRISRMKIIDSEIRNSTVWYSITSDAIEFYLDTKEIKDESKISVSHLLLEKMIKSQNFKGGIEVVSRINEEVNRMQLKKNEIMSLISNDVFAGIDAYEDFVNIGMKWFDDEEKLFRKNKELIEAAMDRMEIDAKPTESYYRTINEIYELEKQLKVAMSRHSELLKACTDLQKLTDDAVRKAKLGRIRSHVNFRNLLNDLISNNRPDMLENIIQPLFLPKIKKNFNVTAIDDALTLRPQKYEVAEKVETKPVKDIVFKDEIEDKRIEWNYVFIMKNLIYMLKIKKSFTLMEFTEQMKKTYGNAVSYNADYFSFFVNLCQRNHYILGEVENDSEGFINAIFQKNFSDSERLEFDISMHSDEIIQLCEGCEVSNVTFVLKND